MNIRIKVCFFTLIAAFAGPSARAGEYWVDLTHPLSSKAVFWPTSQPFELRAEAEGMTEAGYYYSAYSFSGSEHGGTHIDAPVHFVQGAQSVDQVPLSRLIGEAVVVDVSAQSQKNRDYRIATVDLAAWETTNGRIPDGSIVLFRTGFARYWPVAENYLGTSLRGEAGVKALHFPGLHPDAARWLVEQRKIKSVGIDTASIDYGQSSTYDSHVTLMSASVPAFENLANLDSLPARGAFVVALPVKIEGGSGGPLRIVARLP